MATDNEDITPSDNQSPSEPVDDLKNLYVSHIDEVIGLINDKRKVRLQGDILLYGQAEGDVFVVKSLSRFTLYGTLLQPPPKRDRIGVISLVGPLDNLTLTPGPTGQVDKVRLQLHYRALSRLPPLNRYEGVIFSRVEELTVNLTWEWINKGAPTEPLVHLKIGLSMSNLTSSELGLIQTLTFDPIALEFRRRGSEATLPLRNDSLATICPKDTTLAGKEPTWVRELSINFINVSDQPVGQQMKQNCKTQIEGVCEVWWHQAGLNVTGVKQVPDIDTGENLQNITSDKKRKLTKYAVSNRLNVFLVKSSSFSELGGGATFVEGAMTFCLLHVNQLQPNKYLLAHELGHVLGLLDQGAGLLNSVMHSSVNVSCYNPLQNCQTLKLNTLTTLVRPTGVPDQFRPKTTGPCP